MSASKTLEEAAIITVAWMALGFTLYTSRTIKLPAMHVCETKNVVNGSRSIEIPDVEKIDVETLLSGVQLVTRQHYEVTVRAYRNKKLYCAGATILLGILVFAMGARLGEDWKCGVASVFIGPMIIFSFLRSDGGPTLSVASSNSWSDCTEESATHLKKIKERTDWVSWILQGIVGAAVGLLLGFIVISRRRHGYNLNSELLPMFFMGSALIGAGVGSLYGDQLWLGSYYTRYTQEAPATTIVSKGLSCLMIVAGIGLVAWSFIKQFSF